MHAIRATHAFDGVRFLPGGATVVIDGDTIAGVEPGRGDLPSDVEVSDYEGTVLPGLFDCHTHLVADATVGGLQSAGTMSADELDAVIRASLRDHARAGVTTVRDLGDRMYRTLAFRERPGLPRVVAAGPPLTSPGGHCHFLGAEVSGDPRAEVEEHVRHGVDVIKVMASGGFATPGSDQTGAQFTASEIRTMVDAAHRAGLPLIAHAHSLLGARNALDAGADGIEHFSCLSPDGIDVDDGLLDEVARRGVAIGLTMGNDRSLHHLLPDPPPPALAALMARFGVATFDELYDTRLAFLSRLRRHGVLVVAGVDSGMAPIKRHGNAWRTVCEQMDAGYPVAEALASATSLAARACGLQDRTGRLAAGLAADLLVVPGDLTENSAALGTPAAVLLRGTPVQLGPEVPLSEAAGQRLAPSVPDSTPLDEKGTIAVLGQIIQGHTSNPTAARQAMQRWLRDVSPGAVGLVGITAGVTDDGEFIAVLQFDSEEAARADSDRRKQNQGWAGICAALDGEVTVRNGMRTEVFLAGDLGQAQFVQVVQGRVSDLDRARERLPALQEALKVHLPALLGTVTVELEAGRFTRALYFSTEDEARAGEHDMPPEIQAHDQEARQLLVGPVTFMDLREPWLYAAH